MPTEEDKKRLKDAVKNYPGYLGVGIGKELILYVTDSCAECILHIPDELKAGVEVVSSGVISAN